MYFFYLSIFQTLFWKYFADGCRAGYYGDRCINKWRYPNFGKACQKRCPMTHNTIERTVMGIIVSVSVLSSIIIVVAISVIIWRLRGTYRSNRRALHNRSQQAQQKITKATKEQPKQSSLETSNIPIERLQFPWYCRAQPFTNCLDRGLKRPSTDRLYLFCFCYFVFYYVYYLCICEQAFGYIFRIFDFFFNK